MTLNVWNDNVTMKKDGVAVALEPLFGGCKIKPVPEEILVARSPAKMDTRIWMRGPAPKPETQAVPAGYAVTPALFSSARLGKNQQKGLMAVLAEHQVEGKVYLIEDSRVNSLRMDTATAQSLVDMIQKTGLHRLQAELNRATSKAARGNVRG